MTHYFLTLLTIITLALTIGCREQGSSALPPTASTSPPISFTPLPTITPTIPPAPIPTFTPPQIPPTPSADSTPTPKPTIAPTVVQAPVAAAWTGFTYAIAGDAFLYLEYPTDWQVTVYPAVPAVSQPSSQPVFPTIKFFYPTGEKFSIRVDNYAVNLNVYHRPSQEKDVADPHTWDASKIDHQILWEKPLSTQEANGLMFVWRSDASLNGIYYNEKYQVDVRFATNIDNDSLLMAETKGFTETIAERFQVFEHMVNSVRIVKPE